MQGAQVQSLVGELDPAGMLQLRNPHAAAMKILGAATKTQCREREGERERKKERKGKKERGKKGERKKDFLKINK